LSSRILLRLLPLLAAADRTIGASKDFTPTSRKWRCRRHDSRRPAFASPSTPFADDLLFRQFFGDRNRNAPQQPMEQNALGSGVIVRQDGYPTNHHVVDGADQIKVELTDRRTFNAKLVGSDSPSDLALLKVDATNLHALPLGDSDTLRVGDIVLAVGNPLGVGQTVTLGIVSAKGRATGLADGSFEDFIQTDAPINQGNSGGALVNTRGELVGINSQIMSPSGGSIGIGFAIPATMAEDVMAQLVKDGKVRRGLLGVTVQGVTSDLAKSLGLSEVRGALGAPCSRTAPRRMRASSAATSSSTSTATPSPTATACATWLARTQLHSKATPDRRSTRADGDRDAGRTAPGERDAAESTGAARGQRCGGRAHLAGCRPTDGTRQHERLVVNRVAPASPASGGGIQRRRDRARSTMPVMTAAELPERARQFRGPPSLPLLNRRGTDLFVALAPRRG
jgi:S1-C subfamily serine protease